jgi:hypothetical protein
LLVFCRLENQAYSTATFLILAAIHVFPSQGQLPEINAREICQVSLDHLQTIDTWNRKHGDHGDIFRFSNIMTHFGQQWRKRYCIVVVLM